MRVQIRAWALACLVALFAIVPASAAKLPYTLQSIGSTFGQATILPGSTVTIYLVGGTTKASLYDANGDAIANPLHADSNGFATFWADSSAAYYAVWSLGAYTSPAVYFPTNFGDVLSQTNDWLVPQNFAGVKLNGFPGVPTNKNGLNVGAQYHPSWGVVQPSANYSGAQWQVYGTSAQGRATASAGTGNLTLTYGSSADSNWIGMPFFYFHKDGDEFAAVYKVSAVADATHLTVTNVDGSAVSFAAVSGTFHFVSDVATAVANCSGTICTRVSGDLFSPFSDVYHPSYVRISGTLYAITSSTSTTLTLPSSVGTLTGVSLTQYAWDYDNISLFRVQKMLGASEEAMLIGARATGNFEIRSTFAGVGKYRPIVIGSGEISPGKLATQVVVHGDGNLSFGGAYGADSVRVQGNDLTAPTNFLWIPAAFSGSDVTLGAGKNTSDANVGINLTTIGSGTVKANGQPIIAVNGFLGAATATSINGLAITTTSSATLNVVSGKTLRANNTLTFSGTDGSTLNIGGGGTLGAAAYQPLSAFLQPTNNLSDVSSAATARANLGVTATGADTSYAYRANNLSDLANKPTALSNLGGASLTASNTFSGALNSFLAVTIAGTAIVNVDNAEIKFAPTSVGNTNRWRTGSTIAGASDGYWYVQHSTDNFVANFWTPIVCTTTGCGFGNTATPAYAVDVVGQVNASTGFRSGGTAGLSATKTVRASGGAADCTLIYTGGILTGGTC